MQVDYLSSCLYITAKASQSSYYWCCLMDLTDRVDIQKLGYSIKKVIRYNPSLSSRFAFGPGKDHWIGQAVVFERVDLGPGEADLSHQVLEYIKHHPAIIPAEPTGPALKVVLFQRRSDQKRSVLFIINHMLSDGAGFLSVFQHIGEVYQNAPPRALGKLDAYAELRRVVSKKQLSDGFRAFRSNSAPAQPPLIERTPYRPEHPDNHLHYTYFTIDLPQKTTPGWNDRLISSLAKVLFQLSQHHQTPLERANIVLLVDLRRYLSGLAGLGNAIVPHFLSFHQAEVANESIIRQQKQQLGLPFYSVVQKFSRWPIGLTRRVVGSFLKSMVKASYSSITLSDFGRLDERLDALQDICRNLIVLPNVGIHGLPIICSLRWQNRLYISCGKNQDDDLVETVSRLLQHEMEGYCE